MPRTLERGSSGTARPAAIAGAPLRERDRGFCPAPLPYRRLRIAMLSWESLHSIPIGGVAVHVSELAAALAGLGHRVHVFTRRGSDQPPYEQIEGVHYQRCDYHRAPDFVDDVNSMCGAFAASVFGVEDFLGPFDIVHAHDWLAANAMIWIKQARGRRSVVTIHSTEYGRCGNSLAAGQSARVRLQEQAGTYWAEHVIAVSKATMTEVCSLYDIPGWKVTAIHNAVRSERFQRTGATGPLRFQHGIGADDPVVLFCGRLELQKGPDILLESIPSVLASHPRAHFLFAGDGSMRADLKRRRLQLGVEHAVRFLGVVRRDELPALYHMCDIVCVPSRNEPFGIVVLEAWSSAKPVVVTKVGGPVEFVDDGRDGLTVDPDSNAVAAAVGRLVADKAGAASMGRSGERKVRARFTWDAIADQTLEVYDPGRAATAKAAVVSRPVSTCPMRREGHRSARPGSVSCVARQPAQAAPTGELRAEA